MMSVDVATTICIDLYRFYDALDRLLYIGISLNAAQRASQHRQDKQWWGDVARMEVEHLTAASRRDAERVERDAIIAERPLHNITWNATPSRSTAASAWRCQQCRQYIPKGEGRGYLTHRDDRWDVTCKACDVDDAPYWIDLRRIVTTDHVRSWTDHLVGKRWFDSSPWFDALGWHDNRDEFIEAAQNAIINHYLPWVDRGIKPTPA